MRNLVLALKAAGEVTRLRLLALLCQGELTVKDLTDILGQSQPRISRHLKLLCDAGLAERHSEGAWAYFRLSEAGQGRELGQFIIGQLQKNDPQIAKDLERLEALRAEQKTAAEDYFATVAESWDEVRRMHVAEADVEAAILAATRDIKADRLLDLGTGTGRMLELLADRYAHGLGLDSSREMLAVARARLADAQIGHAQVRLGDMTELELDGERYDFISLHQVLHYFDHPAAILARAAQLLATGGQILVVDFAPHENESLRQTHAHRRLGISNEQMKNWSEGAGLELRSHVELPPTDRGEGDGLTVVLWTIAQTNKNTERNKS